MKNIISMSSIAKQLNDRTITDYIFRLSLLAKSVFKWNNLPNGIDEKWIEKYLYTDGKCMMFKDERLGFMVAKCTGVENVNMYDEPTLLRPVATNYTSSKDYQNGKECVLIRNNDDMIPTRHTIDLYAYKLANIDRTIDVNIEAQKMPLIIKCSEKQKLSLQKVIQKRNENEPYIWGDKSLDLEGVEVLNTQAPIVFDKLALQKQRVWNECMTFLGINNANQDKKERLVESEVAANDEQVEQALQVMLKSRQEACNRINALFGTNISVEVRKQEMPSIEELEGYDVGGGENE